jgi:hypothetical protein
MASEACITIVSKAYECKWGNADVSFKQFLKKYPDATTQAVIPSDLLKK